MNIILHNTGLVHIHPQAEATLLILGLAIAAGLWWLGIRQRKHGAPETGLKASHRR